MSYFLIPKTYDYKIKHQDYLQENFKPHSPSLNDQLLILTNQLIELVNNKSIINIKESIIDNYYYLYNEFDNEGLCVSKLNYKSTLFYVFIELISFINLNNFFMDNSISIYISHDDKQDITNSIKYHRAQKNFDENDRYFIKNHIDEQYNFIIYNYDYESNCDLNLSFYKIIKLVLNHLNENGIFIIKVPNLDYSIINQIIYLLSYLFDKTYILKPTISAPLINDKYILCKGFLNNKEIKSLCNNSTNINNILDSTLPVFFLNKVTDINIIFGQKNLDNINVLINLLINRFDTDKLSVFYKTNLVKCINWCDKYKFPCNKFSNQINIFLSKNSKLNENEVVESI
jgi:hypothetical protein